jgi:hypothetical protein
VSSKTFLYFRAKTLGFFQIFAPFAPLRENSEKEK